MLELSESSSYTTTGTKENLTRYYYWSIIGDSEIENSLETGESIPVILTEAAQEASNTLGDTKEAMGWVIVASEDGNVHTEQVEFSQIAELQELEDESRLAQRRASRLAQRRVSKLAQRRVWKNSC